MPATTTTLDMNAYLEIMRMRDDNVRKALTPPDVVNLRTIDDLSNVEGVTVLKGDPAGPPVADDAIPEFRDVQVRMHIDHPLRDRLVKTFTNYLVLTPLSLAIGNDETDPGLSRWAGGTWFSVPSEKSGEEHIQWMTNSLRSINQAKGLFVEYLRQGMVPHFVDPATGRAGTQVMREFKADAGEVIFLDMNAFVAG